VKTYQSTGMPWYFGDSEKCEDALTHVSRRRREQYKFNCHPMSPTHPANDHEAYERQQGMEKRGMRKAAKTNLCNCCSCICRIIWKSLLVVFSLAWFLDDVSCFLFAHRRQPTTPGYRAMQF